MSNPLNSSTEGQRILADWIAEARHCVVFTGAGVSTESGIPDFRGPNGVWSTVDPRQYSYAVYLRDPAIRAERWRHYCAGGIGATAQPNPAHHAIRDLIRHQLAACVITQNVDGLHAASGVPDDQLLEVHGSARFAKCLTCRKRFAREESVAMAVDPDAGVPLCPACGGLLKSGGVSFGEPMPEREMQQATAHARQADLFVVVGSSLTVFPAANLPRLARDHGARLVIVNLGPTKLDPLADVRVDAKAGEFLPTVARLAIARLSAR